MFKIIGYYICEIIQIPQYLDRKGTMISVSDCFGGIHPRLDTCFFRNDYIPQEERDLYKAVWQLDEEKSTQLIREIHRLFGKALASDARFSQLSDARYFYDTYFSRENCIIVSLSTTEKYYEILKKEMQPSQYMTDASISGVIDQSPLPGFDILGWDICSFHSFLCNSLQKRLPTASFNSCGLLANTFDEVTEFSCQIHELGEPVEWLPCRIGLCK